MKKIMWMVMLAMATTAFAEDYKYLIVDCNGVEKSILLESVRKITFENGQVVVATSEGNESFAQSGMNKMFFSETATAIASVAPDGQTPIAVYDLCGRKMPVVNNQMPQLKSGIYIVNGKKVMVK